MKEKEIKDTELEAVAGGITINEGEFIQGSPVASLKTGVRPVEPVIIKPEYEKKTEKDTLIPIP